VKTAADLRFLLLGGSEAPSIALQHHLTGVRRCRHVRAKATRPGRSFERHLRAANKSDRTLETYLEAVRLLAAFLAGRGVRPAAADQDLEPAVAALSKSRQWVLAALRAGGDMQMVKQLGTASPGPGTRSSPAPFRPSLASWKRPGWSPGARKAMAELRCCASGRGDGRVSRCCRWSRGRVPVGALRSELLAADGHSPIH
jgi:hypothetical protein